MISFIQNIDWLILHWIRDNMSCPFLNAVMPAITFLGNAGAIWIIATIILICIKKYRIQGCILACSLIASLLICNILLKNIVCRSRPCWIEVVDLLIKNPTDYSFPSGHAMSSTIGATILTYANKKFGILAKPVALLISFSRLYLYVHFPSDVLAGIILGLIVSFSTIFIFRRVQVHLLNKQQTKNTK